MTAAAPVITIYKNGDRNFLGKKVVVNRRYYRNFENFLDKITEDIRAGVAIRKIHTPHQGTKVDSLEKIHTGATYVAAGSERFRHINYGDSPKPHNNTTSTQPGAFHGKVIAAESRYKKEPLRNRIIFVYRNGEKKAAPMRLLVDKRSLSTMDVFLQFVSDKMKLTGGAVKCVYSIGTMTKVTDVNKIETNMSYVAVGSGKAFIKGKYLNHGEEKNHSLAKSTERREKKKGEKRGDTSLSPEDGRSVNTGSTYTLPTGNEMGTPDAISPVTDEQSKMNVEESTATPIKEEESTTTPIKEEESTTTPIKEEESTTTPIKEEESTTTPIKEEESTTNPIKEDGTPGNVLVEKLDQASETIEDNVNNTDPSLPNLMDEELISVDNTKAVHVVTETLASSSPNLSRNDGIAEELSSTNSVSTTKDIATNTESIDTENDTPISSNTIIATSDQLETEDVSNEMQEITSSTNQADEEVKVIEDESASEMIDTEPSTTQDVEYVPTSDVGSIVTEDINNDEVRSSSKSDDIDGGVPKDDVDKSFADDKDTAFDDRTHDNDVVTENTVNKTDINDDDVANIANKTSIDDDVTEDDGTSTPPTESATQHTEMKSDANTSTQEAQQPPALYKASGNQQESGNQVDDDKDTSVEELIDTLPALEVEEDLG